MFNRIWWKIFLCSFVIFMAGCVPKYVHISPESATGKLCVEKCLNVRNGCYERQEQIEEKRYQECKVESAAKVKECKELEELKYNRCREDAYLDYLGCLKFAKNAKTCSRKECSIGNCRESYCSNRPSYRVCDNDYDSCFLSCGGKIEEIE